MIKKTILNNLITIHDITLLEQHLIYTYLANAKINYSKSPILKEYLENFEKNVQLYLDISSLNISTIKELENYLELIIPISDRKLNGAFFTPEYIVDYIIKEIQPKEDDTNLDPSCGCGAFLVGLAEYYKNKFNKPIRRIIKENIYGSDILNYNIHRAKLILTIYALQNGETLDEIDFNLFHQDSLRTNWNNSFNNIVGNPPYVKFQDLSGENREYLVKRWKTINGGTFNLYFAFFELGYNLLKPNGKLGYITPNNYFTSLAGESIRKYFQKQKCITKIVDFSHKKVFDAQTYTAITFLSKGKNEYIYYDRIKEGKSIEEYLKYSNGSSNILNNLNCKKWRLLKSDEQENITIIETIGKPISKLFDICVGIATLKDEIYFIDGNKVKSDNYVKITENGTFEIEKEIVRPVYKISDFKNQQEVERNARRIICPYNIKNGIAFAIPEKDFQNKYPKCFEYLLSEKENLLSRDKGKVTYDPFYVWGRTQGLTRRGKKILNPTFSLHPRFLLVEEEDAYYTNGYGIYFREQENGSLFVDDSNSIAKIENIDIVLKILNSYVMEYYVTKTSVAIEGGYPCYQKNFIENFSIPDLTEYEIETLRNIKEKQNIDDFLINKYQLKVLVGNLV